MKELRPGVFGTPGFFSKELLDSLKIDGSKSPPGGRYKFDSKKGLKQVKNLMDGLKIAAYYGGPEQQKKDELRKAIEAFGKAHPINPVRSEEDINIRTKKRFPVGY